MRVKKLLAVVTAALLAGGIAACSDDPSDFVTGDGGTENHWVPNYACPGPCTIELDRGESGPNGEVNERTTLAYEGQLVSGSEIDGDGDGVTDKRAAYTYNSDGNKLTEELDGVEWTLQTPQYGADNTVDIRYTYEYDGDGLLSRLEQDGRGPTSVANGTVDRTVDYFYTSGDLMRTEEDSNGDSTMDIIVEYTRDEHGNPLTVTYDGSLYEQADGTVDRIDTYTYTYDSAGRILTDELDEDTDGGIDRKIVYSYTSAGQIATMSEVWYYEGTSLYVENVWNGDQLMSHTYCYDSCSTDAYDYDSYGNLITMEYSNENYSVPVLERTSYWYDCWE